MKLFSDPQRISSSTNLNLIKSHQISSNLIKSRRISSNLFNDGLEFRGMAARPQISSNLIKPHQISTMHPMAWQPVIGFCSVQQDEFGFVLSNLIKYLEFRLRLIKSHQILSNLIKSLEISSILFKSIQR